MTELRDDHSDGVTITLAGDLNVRALPEPVGCVVEALVTNLDNEGASVYPAEGSPELLFERWMGDVFTIHVLHGPKLTILYRSDRRAYLNNFSATDPGAPWVAAAERDPKGYAVNLILDLAAKYLPRTVRR